MKDTILIQQVYPGYGFEGMLTLTEAHHRDYCELYGMDYQAVYDEVFPHDPVIGSYAKIELIQRAMQQGYEYIIWLDADTLIKDISADLRDALVLKKIGACWHRIPQLKHWNVGALYIDNCHATEKFIHEWRGVYPPPKDGWNEQGVFNRLAMQSDCVVTVSDKWNATIDVSMVPDAVVLGFHGQGDAAFRTQFMTDIMQKLFPQPVQIEASVGVKEYGS